MSKNAKEWKFFIDNEHEKKQMHMGFYAEKLFKQCITDFAAEEEAKKQAEKSAMDYQDAMHDLMKELQQTEEARHNAEEHAENMKFLMEQAEATLFNAQQELLTEGQARIRAEDRLAEVAKEAGESYYG